MASKEPKICKQAAAGTTRHITFTIPETLEITRNPGNATSIQVWIVEHLWYNEKQEKNYMYEIYQKRCWLINGMFNNPASLQSGGCEIK